MAILLLPFRAATIEVTSSGKDVPTATTVNQITLSVMPNNCANATAPSTTHLPPITSNVIPANIYKAIFFAHIGENC